MSFARITLSVACVAALAACSPAAPGSATTAPGVAATSAAAVAPASCDSPAQPLALGASAHGDIAAGQTYPNNARYFCVSVGEGAASLTLDLTGASADLDLYVGKDSISSVQGESLQNGEHYQWKSNEFGTGPEHIAIDHPAAGTYYAEVVSYQGQASSFDLAAH